MEPIRKKGKPRGRPYTVENPSPYAFKPGDDNPSVKKARKRRERRGEVSVQDLSFRISVRHMKGTALCLQRALPYSQMKELVEELQHRLATCPREEFGWRTTGLPDPDRARSPLPPGRVITHTTPQDLPEDFPKSPLGGPMNPINAKLVAEQNAKKGPTPYTSPGCPYPVGTIPYLRWHQENRPKFMRCANCAQFDGTRCQATRLRTTKDICQCYGRHFMPRSQSGQAGNR
jgi:hypothetical protein